MLLNHVIVDCPLLFVLSSLLLNRPPTLPPLSGWNELLIASFSHRSVGVKDGILLATDLHVSRETAHTAGVETIFDRYLFTHTHTYTHTHTHCERVLVHSPSQLKAGDSPQFG